MSGKLNPWQPITDAKDLKHLGKLSEEVGELGAAIARCIIQGIDESEPVTGKVNRVWLEDEIADVLANVGLVASHFNLDMVRMEARSNEKATKLLTWHNML